MKKLILIFLIIAALSLLFLVKPVFANSALTWNSTFNAYMIYNCTHLQNMSLNLTGSYRLANNINCSETTTWNSNSGFNPIGTDTSSFNGNLNGAEFNISNLYINRTSTNYVGLIGYTGGASSVRNLNLVDVNISGSSCVGGIVGFSNPITIINCSSSGTVRSSGTTVYDGSTGGILGGSFNSFVVNSYSSANVFAAYTDCGGVVGMLWGGEMNSSYATGNITGPSGTAGLLGQLGPSTTVRNSYATGYVNITSGSGGGGLIGYSGSGSTIINSYFAGAFYGTGSGFLGGSGATCTNCFWDNQTSGKSTSNCAATGKTTAQMKNVSTYTNISSAWDFKYNPYNDTGNNNYWNIDTTSVLNSGYPYLTWQTEEDFTGPTVTLNNPNNSIAYSQSPINIDFNCSATDNIQLSNISLYLTNSSNGNLNLNQTTSLTGIANNTNWTISLTEGTYSWNCYAYDNSSNLNTGTQRTLYVDVTPPNVYLISPANTSNASSSLTFSFNSTFADNAMLKNATLFIWNSTGNIVNQTNRTINGTSNSINISVTLPYKGTYYWNYYTCDLSGNCAFNNTNYTLFANTLPSILWVDILAPVYANSTPVSLASYYDIDGDNGTVVFNWFLNNVNVENDTIANVASGTIASATLTPGFDTYPGWNITLNVTANDSSGILSTVKAWNNVIWQNITISILASGSFNYNCIFCDDNFCYGGDSTGHFLKINKTSGVHVYNGSSSPNNITTNSIEGVYCDSNFCYLGDYTGYFLKVNKTSGVHVFNITTGSRTRPTTNNLYAITCDSDFCYSFDSSGYFLEVNMTSGKHSFNLTTGYTSRPTTTISYGISCDSDFCYSFDYSGYFIKVNKTSGKHSFNLTTGYTSRPTTNLVQSSTYCDSDFCYGADTSGYFIKVNKTSGKHSFNLTTGYTSRPTTATVYGTTCDSDYCYLGDTNGYFLKLNLSSGVHFFNRTAGYTAFMANSTMYSFNCYSDYCYGGDSLGYFTKAYKSANLNIQIASDIPNINIIYPTNTNYSINVSALNYSAAGTGMDSCWYSNNNGTVNSTAVNAGINFTNLTSIEGWNSWDVYCNNTGFTRKATITFYKDTTAPNVTLNSPADSYIGTVVGSTNISFNCSAADNLALKNISLYITNSSNSNFILNRTANITGTSNSSNWTVLNMGVGNYTWNCLAFDSLGNSNWSVNRTIWLETNIAPNVTLNAPANNSLQNKINYILLNATISDYNGYANNFTVWFFGGYANGTRSLINTSFNVTNGTSVTFNWTLGSSGRYNWTVIANDGKANSTNYFFYFNLTNFSVSCEAGGNYQQGALVLVQGTIKNESTVVSSYPVNLSIYDANNNLDANQNLTTVSDGGFKTSFANLSVGSYVLNATATYRGYNETCQDTFAIGSPASFVLDKIVTIQNITNTTINYNITLRLTNKGGSDANNTNITDSDSSDSPYIIGTLDANSSVQRSYIENFERSGNYYSALSIAQALGIDSYSGTLISANSSFINLSIPAVETGQQLMLIKNVYYNSENSTSVNYTISIDVLNSGDINLPSISLIDSDLNLNSLISINASQNYTYSGSLIIDKAASNTNKLFVKATATANSITYSSNQINVRIPGYGGPADAIVNAPASVSASTSFSTTITVENQNPDIGQDFTVEYWITNEQENINYASGQQTIYVAASGSSDLTATLTSPSAAGNYRFKALVSWVGGTATAYDSFTVTSTATPSQTPSGGGGGGITGDIVKDTIVCNPPYIRYGKECCLDKNNNSICDKDETGEEAKMNMEIKNITFNYGEDIETKIKLVNKGDKVDITLNYIIKDLEGNTIYTQKRNVGLYEELEIIEKLDVKLKPGQYILSVSATSNGKEIMNAVTGMSIGKQKTTFNIPMILLIFIIILIIAITITLIRHNRLPQLSRFVAGIKKVKENTAILGGVFLSINNLLKDKIKRILFAIKLEHKDITRLSNIIGINVYSSDGNTIGKVKEIYLENYKIYGWLIKVDKKYNISKKFILVKHNLVKSIKQVMIVDKKVSEHLEELQKEQE